MSRKLKPGKRGNRTKAQKKRKALKLSKVSKPLESSSRVGKARKLSNVYMLRIPTLQALNHADRKEASLHKHKGLTETKKSAKTLWETKKKVLMANAEQLA